MVKPPRADRKIGVFATRAPYRPNPIGMSCVELLGIRGLTIEVGAHDLLDGTPILDIKPYLPYADSFPEARCGWLEEVKQELWEVTFSPLALRQLKWLEAQFALCLRAFLVQQLSESPLDSERKRVRALGKGRWEVAYRTWRAEYSIDEACRRLQVDTLNSGYSPDELARDPDTYGDKAVHRLFTRVFGNPENNADKDGGAKFADGE